MSEAFNWSSNDAHKLKLKLKLLLSPEQDPQLPAVSSFPYSLSPVRLCLLLVASASLRHLSECHVSYLVSFVLIVNNCRNFLLLYVILRMKRSFRLAQTPLLLLLLLLLSLQQSWGLQLATGNWNWQLVTGRRRGKGRGGGRGRRRPLCVRAP